MVACFLTRFAVGDNQEIPNIDLSTELQVMGENGLEHIFGETVKKIVTGTSLRLIRKIVYKPNKIIQIHSISLYDGLQKFRTILGRNPDKNRNPYKNKVPIEN